MRFRSTAWVLLALAAAGAVRGQTETPRGRVVLRAEPGPSLPGRPVTLGIELQIPPGWHTYWENPGDTGMAPDFRWTLPVGVRVGRVRFPVPSRLEEQGLVSLGYEETVCLLADCEMDPGRAPGPTLISLKVEWMICRDACVPISSVASVVLPAGHPAPAHNVDAATLAQWRARLPRPASAVRARAWRAGSRIRLRVEPAPDADVPGTLRWASAWIFPRRFGMLELGVPLAWSREGPAWMVDLAPGPSCPDSGGRLDALWVVPGPAGTVAWELDAELGSAP